MRNQDDSARSAPSLEGPPAGYFLVVPPKDDDADDTIDLVQTVAILRGYWKMLLCAAVLGGGIAAVISLQMRNVYRAQAIVAPTSENNGNNSMKNGLGGIAELAGIDLGGGGGRKVEALATLSSPGIAREFITKYDLMPILYSERWDSEAKRWRAGAKVPTLEMGSKRFRDRRTVVENTKTGLVTVTVEWYSPDLAAKWTMDLIDLVNERMRAADVRTATQQSRLPQPGDGKREYGGVEDGNFSFDRDAN